MEGSIERVTAVLSGATPDRPPLFDLIHNDAVLEHFAAGALTEHNADALVHRAFPMAVDATRPRVRPPAQERTEVLADGRERRIYRWTTWTEPKSYADSEDYAAGKRRELANATTAPTNGPFSNSMAWMVDDMNTERRRLGNLYYMPMLPGPELMRIYGEVGIEAFSYHLVDCPTVIDELLEFNTQRAIEIANRSPDGIGAGFYGDDIAFKSGPLLSPKWLREHYFPRLTRVVSAWHAGDVKVLFHSDGNLNPILDDLVEAGIDGLNPIEVVAGMSVRDIHRRHPHLFLAGGIDASHLLPFGTPQEISDTVIRTIEDAEGRIMIGSSTEVHNRVPLENFLAMHRAAAEYAY